jgi:hypothetical protein
MLELYLSRGSDRQLRLFACACCRRAGGLLDEPTARAAVELAERFADGEASLQELQEARADAFLLTRTHRAAGFQALPFALADDPHLACSRLSEFAAELGFGDAPCGWFRDLLGPAEEVSGIAPSVLAWGGGTALGIARSIYEERRFDDLPVLADALEDAGCSDEAVLAHCRDSAGHARGCWVVDLILGKTHLR